jgi:hypothetical protein
MARERKSDGQAAVGVARGPGLLRAYVPLLCARPRSTPEATPQALGTTSSPASTGLPSKWTCLAAMATGAAGTSAPPTPPRHWPGTASARSGRAPKTSGSSAGPGHTGHSPSGGSRPHSANRPRTWPCEPSARQCPIRSWGCRRHWGVGAARSGPMDSRRPPAGGERA